MNPVFFDYERTPLSLKKTHIALKSFEAYLTKLGTKFAAADHLTIADFPLVTSTTLLEAIDFDLSAYPKVYFFHYEIFEAPRIRIVKI